MTKIADENIIKIETIDGNGKGSIIIIRCQEVSTGNTQIKLEGELRYGIFEKLLGRSIYGIAEKILEEDIRNIEIGITHPNNT